MDLSKAYDYVNRELIISKLATDLAELKVNSQLPISTNTKI